MTPPVLSEGALAILIAHSFPGNVRELKNLIERALIDSGGGLIGPEHLSIRPAVASCAALPTVDAPQAPSPLPLNVREAELELIERALKLTG
jgi:DNA-binding NtrC family response regulator